jgi:hypothetical protein
MYQNINYDFIFSLFYSEEFLIVIFLYNFSQLLLLCVIFELLWPTHIFNKRHLFSVNTIKFRTLTEFFLKLRTSSNILFYLNKIYYLNNKF